MTFLDSEAAFALYGAIVGGGLTISYDVAKTQRETRQRDALVATLLKIELSDLLAVLDGIEGAAADQRQRGSSDVADEPLPDIRTGVFDVFRLGWPKRLLDDEPLVKAIFAIQADTGRIARLLAAREDWRRSKALMSGVGVKLLLYDRIICEAVPRLRTACESAVSRL